MKALPVSLRDKAQLPRLRVAPKDREHCPLVSGATPECADCEDGVATLHKAWRLNTPTDQLLKNALRGAAGGLPLVAFRCPYGGNDCPPIPLGPGSATGPSAGRNSSVQCLTNHTGTLCAECQDGFSRKGASDNHCKVRPAPG